MTPHPLLAVLDTQVWVHIFLRLALKMDPRQPYTAIFEAFTNDEFIPVISRPTYDELQRMLTTSRSVAQFYQIDRGEATEFAESVYFVSEFVEITGALHVSSDPDDDMFVETAIVANANILVAEDSHLHEPLVQQLLREHHIKVMYPRHFRKKLDELRIEKTKGL